MTTTKEEIPMRTLAVLMLAVGLGLAAQPALAQSKAGTDKAFCSEGGSDKKSLECRFDTMAQCETAIKGKSPAKCVPNPKMATKK
jgi:hypothetical protein